MTHPSLNEYERNAPKCCWCRKTIPKKTIRRYLNDLPDDTTIASAQRLTNERVVGLLRSVRGSDHSGAKARRKQGYGYRINGLVTWDGATYVDKFFCKGTCAQAFGRDRAALESRSAIAKATTP